MEVPDPIEYDLEKASQERGFFSRYRTRLLVGAAAVSTAVTFALNPFEDVFDEVKEAAPWVASGIAASEALFIAGGGMMLAALGKKVLNPLKIRSAIPELAERADNSLLFKSGFWINTTGAVGDFVVLSSGVMTNLPPESYGILGLTLLDLGVTIEIRRAILNGIESNSHPTEATQTD